MPRYAAVDIGSNSVRMMAADVGPGGTEILAQERQVTRLGESVFRSGRISKEALDFLSANLARMASIYKRLEIRGVRAVATSAVRDASNQREFLLRASDALGTKVEIISGTEEARLIHMGVEARWPRPKERTLIVDVGGGSAELITSEGGQLSDAVSRPLGAVRLTELFLNSDPPTPEELHRLEKYIDEKLAAFHRVHGEAKFDRVVATSATAAALVSVTNEVPRAKREDADRLRASATQIRDFYQGLVQKDLAARQRIIGIGPRRAEIIIAGVAVFLRTLEIYGSRSLYYCSAGVRDGIIADLAARGVGRELSQLSKEQLSVVQGLAKRYGVALKHARHVGTLAHRLFELLQSFHNLPPAAGKLLEASAYLHDTGHFVSATGHHKHSAYLVAHSDLPGFTDQERLAVAGLCRFHRKAMPQASHPYIQNLDADSKRVVTNLAPLLRIADALDRGHEQKVRDVNATIRDGAVTLSVQADQDAELEIWAATKAAQSFQEVYARPLSLVRARASRV